MSYTPQNAVVREPTHTCTHPVGSVTHGCSCTIGHDHSDAEWRARLPEKTR